ncbi:kinase-like domain-containing protein [Syncephalis pseudoplumigaleata]|uniref:Kinase-like domain-containing protein n=1 Tax=Syncephalis pseudoplumigaleata TaxID=1712513 RepID=A0A4P9YW40_9FUNG|nr:kinase-like domain-containing protein [Syncephalis pseudoplumigaleata]|eukprot:RKP23471.1 kinase-like domain-containing protein [Syncephalis pseudoplumigaleata]
MSPFSQDHCRISLLSGLWLSAEYDPYYQVCMTDDYIPFAVYNQEYIVGEEEALGVPGLVFEEERSTRGAMSDYTGYVSYYGRPGFIKCSYKLDWYDREVYALMVLTYFRTGDGFGCMVLDMVDGVTLKEFANELSPLQRDVDLRDVVRQLLVDVMVNILPATTDGRPRFRTTLIDFNLALPTANGSEYPPNGHTVGMTPPEFYARREIDLRAFDAWQLGAMLYSLFMNRAPYEIDYDENNQKTNWPVPQRRKFMRELMRHQQHSYAALNCSSDARDFIEQLLQIDPAKRPTMKELMWHKWLR